MSKDALLEIFKAYDVRGKVGTELTEEVAEKIGLALAQWLPEEGAVAVGRDMRGDSEDLASALKKGLTEGGRDVIDIGKVTTDMIYFATGSLGLAGGVVVTASHNPGADNGIKFCRENAIAIGKDTGLFDIRDLVIEDNFELADKPGKVEQKDVTEDWITHVLSFIKPKKLKPLKVAVDAGNGMAGKIFPELEPFIPFEISEMYFELDGTFPNHEANPLKFETLEDLIENIKTNNLDAGIAFDGDGDRAFLIDETGTVLTGGVMSAMLSEYFLSLHPGAPIVYDIRNSRSVPEVIEENGGRPVLCRVGHSYIKSAMRENDAPFGGEASGHFYFRDNWYADSGLIGAVIGLYVANIQDKKLSEIREKYTRFAAMPETNFEVEDKEKVMNAIADAFPDTEANRLDGVTLELGRGKWVNVRPSNTEPLLRVNAEAPTQDELDELLGKVVEIIKRG